MSSERSWRRRFDDSHDGDRVSPELPVRRSRTAGK
jgi:hypothetical protein